MRIVAIESREGSITPTVVAGRAADEPDEIVLGTRTRRDAGLAIGDAVEVALGDVTARYTIVGPGCSLISRVRPDSATARG
jgi:hypothetical protein